MVKIVFVCICILFVVNAKTITVLAYEIGTTISSKITCRMVIKKNSVNSDFINVFNSLNNIDDIRYVLDNSGTELDLTSYNTLGDVQKYVISITLLDNKGSEYLDKSEIQSALDLAVSSVIIPDSSVSTTISVVYNKDYGKDLKITAKAEYTGYNYLNDNILVDGLITMNMPICSDTKVSMLYGDIVIGQYTLRANSDSFWVSDFYSSNNPIPLKLHSVDEYNFVIEEVPPDFYNNDITFSFKLIASIAGCFDNQDEWIKELSLSSNTVNIIKPTSPFTVYVGNYNTQIPGWEIVKFNSVKAAVSKVAQGGIVRIDPGTYCFIDSYDDRLSISKSISIIGADMNNTILEIYPPNNNPTQDLGAFYVSGDVDFCLSNITFKIKGNIAGTKSSCIVNTRCKNAAIKDVSFININNNSKVECGIKVAKYTLNPGVAKIDGCIFENIYKFGISIEGGAKANIGLNSANNFSFSNGFTRAEVQNAINILNGEGVTVQNSTISGYAVPLSAGIYVNSGSVGITGNIFTEHNPYRDIYINVGTTIGSIKVTNETAAIAGIELGEINNASVGIYSSGSIIYP